MGILKISVLNFLLVLSLSVHAVNCGKFTKNITHGLDSSVELELSTTEALHILTTKDGKVSGLLQDYRTPDWFIEYANTYHVEYPNPKDVPWDDLSDRNKIKLLRYRTTFKKTDYFSDRTIQGMKVKDNLEFDFKEETTFLGKTYPKGKSTIDLSGNFGKVEYCCDDDGMKNVSMVELHFRSPLPAGETSNSAWQVLDYSNIRRNHQHVHTVSKIPIEKLEEKPELYTAMLSDILRRSNIMSEALGFWLYGTTVYPNKVADVTYFDHLSDIRLLFAAQFFAKKSEGINVKLGDNIKMGWVGMRGDDVYDAPGLWGLEYRQISSRYKPSDMNLVLNAVQDEMNNFDTKALRDQMSDWLKTKKINNPMDVASEISSNLYHQKWVDLYDQALPKVKAELKRTGFVSRKTAYQIMEKYSDDRNRLVKMIAYNWFSDPLFFNNPKKLKRIEEAQIKAIKEIRGTASMLSMSSRSVDQITRGFLYESGILEEFLGSFSLKLSDFN